MTASTLERGAKLQRVAELLEQGRGSTSIFVDAECGRVVIWFGSRRFHIDPAAARTLATMVFARAYTAQVQEDGAPEASDWSPVFCVCLGPEAEKL